MGSEWTEVPIGSLCEGIYDGPHATPTKTDTGPVFLGISSLVKGRLDISQSDHLSEEDFPRWTRRVVPTKDDLVFSYETRLGEAALIPEGLRCCLGRRMALMRLDRNKADPHFVLYAFLSPQFQNVIRSRTKHGSTVTRILLTEFGDFPIAIPPIGEQRAIGEILGALDERVDKLSESNKTCEEIARTIFKSWFVDFDPVRAKADVRELDGMDAATAALFPREFENSEVGKIPRGWKVGSIFDVANLLSGGTPKTDRSEYWGGGIDWASAKDVSQCRDSFLIASERRITQRGLAESSTKLIPAYSTVVVARGATTGRMVILGREMAMNQTCYALASTVESPFTLYCLVQSLMSTLVHAAHGSVFETITTSTFSGTRLLLPPSTLLMSCESVIETLFKRILVNTEMSLALSEIRDTLLPRLISGKLRIPAAEKMMETVL
jgi:type I restriction enzyme S subunit